MAASAVTSGTRQQSISLTGKNLTLVELAAISLRECSLRIELSNDARARVDRSAQAVQEAIQQGQVIYGVTTGFGGMATEAVPSEHATELQNNLLSFLAAGAGEPIDRRHVRGAMALRANVLLQGCSGIRYEVIERLFHFLNADAVPVVRELGSIGASGDLVPLATIARAITGVQNRAHVQFGDEIVDSQEALRRLELEPLELKAKEGLALANGTSFSASIAGNALFEAERLFALSMMVQAFMLRALDARLDPFEPFVHQQKPHPGQVWVASIVKRLLEKGAVASEYDSSLVQDRYALRCLPQYLGSVAEGLRRIRQVIEIEMNGVSDNPLIDPESCKFYQSGNFLGQYAGIAMDDLRKYIGLTAKHLDVQIASLVTPEFSGGLPSSLRGNDELPYNMGLKGLQITGNSIMPMLTYLGNPLVDHFPTHAEQFNQNVNGLSWGASNLAWKSVEMFRQYLAISLIFGVQSLDLRAKQSLGHFDGRQLIGDELGRLYATTYEILQCEPGEKQPFLFNDSDRWLEQDIAELVRSWDHESRFEDAIEPVLQSFTNDLGDTV